MALLQNKKALVTGGSAGIGKAIAIAFAKEGSDVAIFGTKEPALQETLQEMQNSKIREDQKFLYFVVDVSKTALVEETIQKLLSAWVSIDILVNNAGITKDNLLMKMSEEDWDDVLKVNLKSMFNCCKSLIRTLLKQKSGKVINISSVVGLMGNPGQTNYAASKAGVIGFTKALAKEVARKSICVNCIAPGYIETRMTSQLSEEAKKALIEEIPLQRIGQGTDIANAAVFLASHMSDYITGQVITVDGGMVI